jgi:excisionase family DNA binding protein
MEARMADRVLIPLPGIGTLALERDVYEQALTAGRDVNAAVSAAQNNEPLFDSDELAQLLKVPATWIEQKAREGVIPSLEFGRWRRFRRSEVESAVRASREH